MWLINWLIVTCLQSYKSLWVPTGELLLDKIFQHNTTHALNNSIGLTFWQEIDSTFPNEHGIKAIWTGVERFNATHFSERFYHMAKVYLLELNDLIRGRASNATVMLVTIFGCWWHEIIVVTNRFRLQHQSATSMSPTSNKTFEDSDRGGNFLKPNEYFEPELKNDEIKVYPEHVQYAAQNMRLDLSLPLSFLTFFKWWS